MRIRLGLLMIGVSVAAVACSPVQVDNETEQQLETSTTVSAPPTSQAAPPTSAPVTTTKVFSTLLGASLASSGRGDRMCEWRLSFDRFSVSYEAFGCDGSLVDSGAGRLTPEAVEQLTEALDALEGVAFEDWYGMAPFITDGSAFTLSMDLDGVIVETGWVPSFFGSSYVVKTAVPSELLSLGELVWDVRKAIADCEPAGLVEFDGFCLPYVRESTWPTPILGMQGASRPT